MAGKLINLNTTSTYTTDDLEIIALGIIDLLKQHNTKTLLFKGDLGSGKTTLIQKISKLLGYEKETNSPTFQIINEYLLPSKRIIYHIDLYRLENYSQAQKVGVEDIIYDHTHYVFIEWPQIILDCYHNDLSALTILIKKHKQNDARNIIVQSI